MFDSRGSLYAEARQASGARVRLGVWVSRPGKNYKLQKVCDTNFLVCMSPMDKRVDRDTVIQILTRFNDQIKSLSSGELITEANLFVQLRAEYKEWNDHLEGTEISFKESTEEKIEHIQDYRGRELPGFSNYRNFENILQKPVAKLKEPALDLLNSIKGIIIKQFTDVVNQCFRNYPVLLKITTDKINNIQSSQQEKAEQRISEQFEMENMIYTQDPIYLKSLNEITDETFSEKELPVFDKKSKYIDMLEAYYMIVVQRMADQLPMMISFFMLKQTAQLLSSDMLSLLDGANVSELLFEDSDVSRRRKDLEARLDRLSTGQKTMSSFERSAY